MDQRYVRIQVGKVNIAVKESYTVIKCLLCNNDFIEVTQILTYTGPLGSGEFTKAEHKVIINTAAISLISSNQETKIQ